jgi:hypothetical protein
MSIWPIFLQVDTRLVNTQFLATWFREEPGKLQALYLSTRKLELGRAIICVETSGYPNDANLVCLNLQEPSPERKRHKASKGLIELIYWKGVRAGSHPLKLYWNKRPLSPRRDGYRNTISDLAPKFGQTNGLGCSIVPRKRVYRREMIRSAIRQYTYYLSIYYRITELQLVDVTESRKL